MHYLCNERIGKACMSLKKCNLCIECKEDLHIR